MIALRRTPHGESGPPGSVLEAAITGSECSPGESWTFSISGLLALLALRESEVRVIKTYVPLACRDGF